jgi:hypothetical protein
MAKTAIEVESNFTNEISEKYATSATRMIISTIQARKGQDGNNKCISSHFVSPLNREDRGKIKLF